MTHLPITLPESLDNDTLLNIILCVMHAQKKRELEQTQEICDGFTEFNVFSQAKRLKVLRESCQTPQAIAIMTDWLAASLDGGSLIAENIMGAGDA